MFSFPAATAALTFPFDLANTHSLTHLGFPHPFFPPALLFLPWAFSTQSFSPLVGILMQSCLWAAFNCKLKFCAQDFVRKGLTDAKDPRSKSFGVFLGSSKINKCCRLFLGSTLRKTFSHCPCIYPALAAFVFLVPSARQKLNTTLLLTRLPELNVER